MSETTLRLPSYYFQKLSEVLNHIVTLNSVFENLCVLIDITA